MRTVAELKRADRKERSPTRSGITQDLFAIISQLKDEIHRYNNELSDALTEVERLKDALYKIKREAGKVDRFKHCWPKQQHKCFEIAKKALKGG